MYTLKIEGLISKNKKEEFNQSINLFVQKLPPECQKYNIAEDIRRIGILHFDSIWISKFNLEKFMKTDQYKAILGAFKVLGENVEITMGEIYNHTQK